MLMQNGILNLKRDSKQFYIEAFLAVIIAALSSLAAFSTLLFCSNDLYPITADGMGHLTKVRYLAESYSNFQFPSWFPFWYNGSTVMQYYPPLSYLTMAPIEMIVHNVTLTYKIYCFLVLFIGGLGVWVFCRKFIGNWCGLFAVVIYCIQQYLTRALFGAGVLAQGPVFALTPWFLIAVLRFSLAPNKKDFFYISVGTFLLILSHAMHAYMVCLCLAIVMFVFVCLKRVLFRNYFLLGCSMAVGAMLAGYWWAVGAITLETPGVPYLLEEAGLLYTATWEWFFPGEGNKAGFIYSYSVSLACILALLIYIMYALKKKNTENAKYYVFFNILLTFFTFFFSFGKNLPGFFVVPLSSSLVPGRILSLSAATGAITCAWLFYAIMKMSKGKKVWAKALSGMVCIVILSLLLIQMNPYNDHHHTMDVDEEYELLLSHFVGEGEPFDKGRYEWVAPVNCVETYFPVQYGFNISDGWNIEGSPHNRSIWSYNVALSADCEDYVIKDLMFWNVRNVFTLQSRENMRQKLEESIYDFAYEKELGKMNAGVLYTSDLPSSYYLIDKRDALTLGKGSQGITLEFPYMVKNFENDITKYSMEELKRYKLIYIAEPPVERIGAVERFDAVISELVKGGALVIIEPSNIQNIPILGVSSYDISFGRTPQLVKSDTVPFATSVDKIDFYEGGTTRALSGLDEVYYRLYDNDGALVNDIIGSKNLEGGKVYFIGMHLSQYLKASNITIYGLNRENYYFPYHDKVKSLLWDLMSLAEPNTDFTPDHFPVTDSTWDYKSGEFSYTSEKPQQITVSVTYTPRWKVTVDGETVKVGQRESLVVLDLPAGAHTVRMHYGLSKYGIVGYIISISGILLLLLLLFFFDKLISVSDDTGRSIAEILEIH